MTPVEGGREHSYRGREGGRGGVTAPGLEVDREGRAVTVPTGRSLVYSAASVLQYSTVQ